MGNLDLLLEALCCGVQVEGLYDGQPRLLEVHAVGETTTGKLAARVFQTAGTSNTGDIPDWRLMRLDKLARLSLRRDLASQAPRPDYRRGDKGMRKIIKEV